MTAFDYKYMNDGALQRAMTDALQEMDKSREESVLAAERWKKAQTVVREVQEERNIRAERSIRASR